ncbi:maltokinase N-terminal cap-like domain-containing protein [Actinocorallia longicatena]|uniref:Maltokinase N-terminal cap domain-containing protein n=1 Tax=Actinocorallia longicatena TaxID=111803 RepID=A0ABP6Q324_9ACTN
MAVIHRTVLTPTKLELLTAWLPSRPWYRGGPGGPELAKAGGFRLDDPEGEVGIEFMVVTDTSTPDPVTYLVPMTYRGAPLPGAGHALIGTMDHGVLGSRWAYDGCHDPVLITQLQSLIEGRAHPQAQSITDTPDPDVTRSCTAPSLPPTDFTTPTTDTPEGTTLPAPHGTTLHLHRLLTPTKAPTPNQATPLTPNPNPTAHPTDHPIGHVTGHWRTPSGTPARGLFATLHSTP